MPLLPAQIPAIPESRSEVVPARLARKVGPLFGVAWDDGPFGHRTWVSDYSRTTLSEIARGAPLPPRGRSARHTGATHSSWEVTDRIGVTVPGGSLPNEIANATLNRFGPDTRAAVMLTAANQLLDPVHLAIQETLTLLTDDIGHPLAPELRLAAWAALVVETFRSQPALVAAALRARAIQRELVTPWRLPLSPALACTPLTRCEISAPDRAASPSQPMDLDVVDTTFAALGLGSGDDSALARRLRHDETVDRLVRRLQAAGTLQDASHLWLGERRPGEVVVEALVPPTQLIHDVVKPFLTAGGPPPLPRVPGPEEAAALPILTRRALLIALLGALRHLQFTPEGFDRTRSDVVAAAARISELARCLPSDDPVRAVARCRAAIITVETTRHSTTHDLSSTVLELVAATDDCIAAQQEGRLDRGAAAEVIGAANVVVNVVRRNNATDPDAGLPDPDVLDCWLRGSWHAYLRALDVHPSELLTPDPDRLGLIGFHLHTYAAFLGGHPGSEADVRAAERLFREIVLPARARFHENGGSFDSLRYSLQVSTRVTGTLSGCARAAGDLPAARGWAGAGLERIRVAMADPSTTALLSTPTDTACRFALLAAPALVLAVELGVLGAGAADVRTAADLVALARRWEEQALDTPGTHPRHPEVVALEQRLSALSRDHPEVPVPVASV